MAHGSREFESKRNLRIDNKKEKESETRRSTSFNRSRPFLRLAHSDDHYADDDYAFANSVIFVIAFATLSYDVRAIRFCWKLNRNLISIHLSFNKTDDDYIFVVTNGE